MKLRLDKIASSTRNANLHREVVVGGPIPAAQGTVLAVKALDTKSSYNQIEDLHGRMVPVHAGDIIAGVVGSRQALRGYAGRIPEKIEKGDILHLLNLGGVIGECTSINPEVGEPCRVEVLGAVLTFAELGRREGKPASIFPGPVPLLNTIPQSMPPTLFVAGTCMSAGKTSAACRLIRELTHRGLKIATTKVTGVALRRDSLEMVDHGSIQSVTFTDVGFASTTGGEVSDIAKSCLTALSSLPVDLIVAELGDGIMGSYGVDQVLADEMIKGVPGAMMLAANDPVGAWGAIEWLKDRGWRPAVVTGPATDNDAGTSAIEKLTDVPSINARKEPSRLADVVLDALKEYMK